MIFLFLVFSSAPSQPGQVSTVSGMVGKEPCADSIDLGAAGGAVSGLRPGTLVAAVSPVRWPWALALYAVRRPISR